MQNLHERQVLFFNFSFVSIMTDIEKTPLENEGENEATPVVSVSENTAESGKGDDNALSKRNPKERGERGGKGKGRGRKRERGGKEEKEFDEEVLDIARVTRVVKGGRRLRFRATVAIGDRKGRVGVGTGKSVEVATSIRKAVSDAKKNLITVPLTQGTIPHDLKVKYKSAALLLMPAPVGTGVIAGGAFRKIAILAGITDVFAKSHGTSNPLVSAQASMRALSGFSPTRRKKTEETEKEGV